jgi:hypothetical protein
MKAKSHLPYEFLWGVPECGYRWTEAAICPTNTAEPKFDPPQQPVLIENVGAGTQFPERFYAPLREHPALFRTFAATPLTAAGILSFANEYGRLGVKVIAEERMPRPAAPRTRPSTRVSDWDKQALENQILSKTLRPWQFYAERLDEWRKQILAMRVTLEIWEMSQAPDPAGLSRYFQRETRSDLGRAVIFNPRWDLQQERPQAARDLPLGVRVVASETIYSELQGLLLSDDLVLPARLFVNQQIGNELDGKVTPQLFYDPSSRRSISRWVPNSLLSALWVQFHHAVAANNEWRQCGGCGTWFEVIPSREMRSTRRHCSEACRLRAYRERQEKARKLKAEGRSVRYIAKELDIDIETIKQWVSNRKG